MGSGGRTPEVTSAPAASEGTGLWRGRAFRSAGDVSPQGSPARFQSVFRVAAASPPRAGRLPGGAAVSDAETELRSCRHVRAGTFVNGLEQRAVVFKPLDHAAHKANRLAFSP